MANIYKVLRLQLLTYIFLEYVVVRTNPVPTSSAARPRSTMVQQRCRLWYDKNVLLTIPHRSLDYIVLIHS